MTEAPSVGVVVPAYHPNVSVLESYVRSLEKRIRPKTILVELEAANRTTVSRLQSMPALVHAADTRRGKGAAVSCGFDHLETDVLAFVDADASTPAESLAAVLEPVVEERADLAVGSRRHPNAVIETPQPRLRRWLGTGFAWLARRLLEVSLSDYQCGAKAITREMWLEVRSDLIEPGFAWDVDLVTRVGARGGRITEVPITWRDSPETTVAPVGTVVELLRGLIRVRLRESIENATSWFRRRWTAYRHLEPET